VKFHGFPTKGETQPVRNSPFSRALILGENLLQALSGYTRAVVFHFETNIIIEFQSGQDDLPAL
jgi:hypothetical protein